MYYYHCNVLSIPTYYNIYILIYYYSTHIKKKNDEYKVLLKRFND